jgi:rhamnosyltransferase subunit B
LQERGHSVVVATLEWHRKRVEEAGLQFRPTGPDIAEFGSEADFMERVMDQKRGFEFIIRDVEMAHLKRSYEAISCVAMDADMLVTHPLSFAAQLFAEKNSDRTARVEALHG